MKRNTNIRIVCLRNENNQQNLQQRSGFISTLKQPEETQNDNNLTPSLAYLSARLQEAAKNNHHTTNHQSNQLDLNANHSAASIEISETRGERQSPQTKLPTIQKYFQGQKYMTEAKKQTIRNMMGSIDFSASKAKEKKIARAIKQTIGGLSATDSLVKSKRTPHQSTNKFNNSENRAFLQVDFQNFLNNKNHQFEQLTKPKVDEEAIKLRRLCVTNPERDTSKDQPTFKYDLFHFQSDLPVKQKRPLNKKPFGSEHHKSLAKTRLQQKIFKMQLNLKTQEQQFEWSRFNSSKGFAFQTIHH